MSKDEFNKRLLRKFTTPEKRYKLYSEIYNAMSSLMKLQCIPLGISSKKIDFVKKNEKEQLTVIRNLVNVISAISGQISWLESEYVPTMIQPLREMYTSFMYGDFTKSDKHLSKLLKNTGLDKL